jgi:hypothetical protein
MDRETEKVLCTSKLEVDASSPSQVIKLIDG